jgi:hypothetical protein
MITGNVPIDFRLISLPEHRNIFPSQAPSVYGV